MTNEELFQKLRPIIELVTGLAPGQVVLADQHEDAPAPSGEYATIYPRQSVIERGQANVRTTDKVGNLVQFDIRAQVIATCSVNFFRGNAHQYAEMLKQCNKRPDVSIMLYQAGIGWGGTDAVNNLTGLQSAKWEQRAQINIRVMYEVQSLPEINNILSASVSIENEDADVLAEFTVQ